MTADAADRPDVIDPVPSFAARRAALFARPGLSGDELCRAYAAEADDWLTRLLLKASDGNVKGLALLAAGGYGRGELAPGSDLDVVLLHDRRKDVARIADAIPASDRDGAVHPGRRGGHHKRDYLLRAGQHRWPCPFKSGIREPLAPDVCTPE